MPPRGLALAIVAFWLGMTGWLFWRDLWPRWRTGGPPPYTIDLIEEVHRQKTYHTPWVVFQDGRETMKAESWVEHRGADDTFELHQEFKPKTTFGKQPAGVIPKVRPVSSMMRVTREGDLRELEANFAVDSAAGPMTAHFASAVRDDHLHTRYRLELAGQLLREGSFPPVAVSHHGSLLLPSQVVNRVQGLRPGQSWHMPVLDPFGAGFGLSDAVRHVDARVLPRTQELEWRGKGKTCLVIEYTGDETGSTWVEARSGLVQRQEASLGGSRLVLQRDD